MGFIVICLIILFLIGCFSNDEKEKESAMSIISKTICKIFFH
ncbi:hypothetical protein IMSAGC018_01097 [Lachnospiraceae bacterium]|nr:hypothetical protein IMSAGC018_01097 [Lachnospiraceae bacterium]